MGREEELGAQMESQSGGTRERPPLLPPRRVDTALRSGHWTEPTAAALQGGPVRFSLYSGVKGQVFRPTPKPGIFTARVSEGTLVLGLKTGDKTLVQDNKCQGTWWGRRGLSRTPTLWPCDASNAVPWPDRPGSNLL